MVTPEISKKDLSLNDADPYILVERQRSPGRAHIFRTKRLNIVEIPVELNYSLFSIPTSRPWDYLLRVGEPTSQRQLLVELLEESQKN